MNNKILLFYLYGSEAFSGTEDKRANIIAKDIPLAFMAQEIPRVWLVTCKPLTVDEDYIYIYILQNTVLHLQSLKYLPPGPLPKKQFIKPD